MQKLLNIIIKYSVYLLVFLLPLFFSPFSFEAFEFNKQYLLIFLVSLAFLAWIFRMIVYGREIRLRRTPIDVPVLLFLFVTTLGVFFSVDTFSSILGSYGRFSDGLLGILSLGMLYFIVVNNTEIDNDKSKTEKREQEAENKKQRTGSILTVKGILKTYLLSSGIIVIFTYFSLFGLWSKLESAIGGKGLPQVMMFKTFNLAAGSLEGLAMILVSVVILVMGLLLYSSKKITNIFSWTFLILAMFLLFWIDFTPSWLVLGVTSVLIFGTAFFKKLCQERINILLLPIAILLICLVGGLFRSSLVLSTFFSPSELITNTDNDIISEKFNLPQEIVPDQKTSWKIALESVKEKPIFGSGIGTYYYDFFKFKPVEFNQTIYWNIGFNRAGSYVSEILSTGGILGILSYTLLIGAFLFGLLGKRVPDNTGQTSEVIEKIKKRISVIDLGAGKSAKENIISRNASETITDHEPDSPRSEAEAGGRVRMLFYIFCLFFPLLALIISQFLYYQNTILAFTFWLFLGVIFASQSQNLSWRRISLKDSPEKTLIFNFLLIVLIVLFSGVYYAGIRFYVSDVRYTRQLKSDLAQNLDERIRITESAINLNHHIPQYRIDLAALYLAKVLKEVQKPIEDINQDILQSSISKTIGEAKAATDISPNNLFTWKARGVAYREIRGLVAGAEEWAIESLGEAVKLEPTNPILHSELGKLYLAESGTVSDEKEKQNYASKAKQEFDAAARLKPDYLDAQIQLGLWEENQGNIKEAINKFENLKKNLTVEAYYQDQFSAQEIMFNLGRLYFNDGQIDKAILEFETVVELNPNHSNAHYSLGLAYQTKGEKEKALKEFEKVLELNPGSKDVQSRIEGLKK